MFEAQPQYTKIIIINGKDGKQRLVYIHSRKGDIHIHNETIGYNTCETIYLKIEMNV